MSALHDADLVRGREEYLLRIPRQGEQAHHLESEIYQRPTFERPREVMGVEIGSWRDCFEIVAGVLVIGALFVELMLVAAVLS